MPGKNMIEEIMNRPQPLPRVVPDYMRKRGGLWYWTGAMVMIAFLYEALTGIILLLFYSPASAYKSTTDFVADIPFGSVILTTHLYGAYAMIVLLYVHMLRSLFVGAYKRPREMQWLLGVLLLLLTIGVAYFGYSMVGDALAVNAEDVGKGIASGFPVIGWWLALVFFGSSPEQLYTRFLGWHIILAGAILILFAVHFFLAEYNTIMPRVDSEHGKAPHIDREDPSYKPWYPYNLLYMLQLTFLVIGLIIIIPSIVALIPNVPVLFSPFPQAAPGTAAAASLPPYPPWFLLFIYKELDFSLAAAWGPFWGSVVFLGAPLLYLAALPWLDRGDSLKMVHRKNTVAFGIMGIFYLAWLSLWGAVEPGIPIPTWEWLAFFFAVGLGVYLPTHFVLTRIERGTLKIGSPGRFALSLGMLALTSFGSGFLIMASLATGSATSTISMILLLMSMAISLTVAVAYLRGVLPLQIGQPEGRRLRGKTYTFIGSVYTFAGIAILGVMLAITPNSIYNNSLYGVGLGLLFLIAFGLLRLYRSFAYGE